jgi:hypothetical protein
MILTLSHFYDFLPMWRFLPLGIFYALNIFSMLHILILLHELTLRLFSTFPHAKKSIHTFSPHFYNPHFSLCTSAIPIFLQHLAIFLTSSHSYLLKYSILSHFFQLLPPPIILFLCVTFSLHYLYLSSYLLQCPILSQF